MRESSPGWEMTVESGPFAKCPKRWGNVPSHPRVSDYRSGAGRLEYVGLSLGMSEWWGSEFEGEVGMGTGAGFLFRGGFGLERFGVGVAEFEILLQFLRFLQ